MFRNWTRWSERRLWCSLVLRRRWRLRLGALVPEVIRRSTVMASLGSRRSSDFRELWINSEEDITGVSFKIGLSALSKIMQRLWLTLLEVCCHLFGTGSEVLFLDEELLHSVVPSYVSAALARSIQR